MGLFVPCFGLPGICVLGWKWVSRASKIFVTPHRHEDLTFVPLWCTPGSAGDGWHTPGGSSVMLSKNEAGHKRAFFVRVHASCHDLHGLCGAYVFRVDPYFVWVKFGSGMWMLACYILGYYDGN